MPGLVFFIDVDNTLIDNDGVKKLIDNDGVKKDLDAHPNFKPDITVLHIGDLRTYTAEQFLKIQK